VSSSGISVYQLEESCFIYRHRGEYVPKVQLEETHSPELAGGAEMFFLDVGALE